MDSAVFLLLPGSKIYYGHLTYEPKWCKFWSWWFIVPLTCLLPFPLTSSPQPSPCDNNDELLQVFIPRMYDNYRIENRAYKEPAAILFTSATWKDGIPPTAVGLSWDSPHPPPESVRADGHTLTSEPKFFGLNGLPICLPMVLRELRYKFWICHCKEFQVACFWDYCGYSYSGLGITEHKECQFRKERSLWKQNTHGGGDLRTTTMSAAAYLAKDFSKERLFCLFRVNLIIPFILFILLSGAEWTGWSSGMNGLIFRSFRKQNSSQKKTNTVYSEYTYSGIITKERVPRFLIQLSSLESSMKK